MDDGGQQEPFLDRPVRSLLDVKLGTVLKAYLAYIAIGLVTVAVVAAVILSKRHEEFGANGGPASPSGISWADDAGDTVTPAEYRTVQTGAGLDAVRRRFGTPATTGHNPLDTVDGDTQSCLGYRSSASSELFLFCFSDGRLVDKETF